MNVTARMEIECSFLHFLSEPYRYYKKMTFFIVQCFAEEILK